MNNPIPTTAETEKPKYRFLLLSSDVEEWKLTLKEGQICNLKRLELSRIVAVGRERILCCVSEKQTERTQREEKRRGESGSGRRKRESL